MAVVTMHYEREWVYIYVKDLLIGDYMMSYGEVTELRQDMVTFKWSDGEGDGWTMPFHPNELICVQYRRGRELQEPYYFSRAREGTRRGLPTPVSPPHA